ncbi:MAG: MBL fold metallo-hydrolase [Myxococcales bacterium]|nr:MBL fold metallo-hydrolase [Myxococcales bacterium]
MSCFVRFWGTRGSIPTPGRKTHRYGGNTSCVEVRIDDSMFVLDGGTGLRELGVDLLKRGPAPVRAHMLFSHMHWDHIQGFPFFVPAYLPNSRLSIYGTFTGDRRHHQLLSGQMSSDYFPVDFSSLNANIVASDLGPPTGRIIEGVAVRCFDQRHPGGSYAYSLEKDGVRVVYSTDNEVDLGLADPAAAQRDLAAPRELPPELVAFCRGADLLIADGQYTDDEYVKKVGWGHPRASTVTDLAVQAGVGQLAIFHHDPMHSDDHIDALVGECRERVARWGSGVIVFAAREGMTLKLG